VALQQTKKRDLIEEERRNKSTAMSKQSERIRLEVEFQKKRVALLEKSGARTLRELLESAVLAQKYRRELKTLRHLASKFNALNKRDAR
jgi:hypothetical protein